MEYDHEENDSFAFVRNADISDDAGTGAGAGADVNRTILKSACRAGILIRESEFETEEDTDSTTS